MLELPELQRKDIEICQPRNVRRVWSVKNNLLGWTWTQSRTGLRGKPGQVLHKPGDNLGLLLGYRIPIPAPSRRHRQESAGPGPRSVNFDESPAGCVFHAGRGETGKVARPDRRACYFGVTQRYRTRRDRRCIFWQPIRLNRRSMCQMLALSSHPTCHVDRTRKRGNSTPSFSAFRPRLDRRPPRAIPGWIFPPTVISGVRDFAGSSASQLGRPWERTVRATAPFRRSRLHAGGKKGVPLFTIKLSNKNDIGKYNLRGCSQNQLSLSRSYFSKRESVLRTSLRPVVIKARNILSIHNYSSLYEPAKMSECPKVRFQGSETALAPAGRPSYI